MIEIFMGNHRWRRPPIDLYLFSLLLRLNKGSIRWLNKGSIRWLA